MHRDLELDRSPTYQLWLATNAWQRDVRRKLDPLGLTHVQFVVLASAMRLCHTEECLTQAKVSRLAELDENMTSQVIRVLERRGWVIRVKHPTDRRAHRIELTDSGIKLAMAARTLVKEAAERFFEPLGDRREEFVDALRTLNAHAAG